jgi:hypothetical protein
VPVTDGVYLAPELVELGLKAVAVVKTSNPPGRFDLNVGGARTPGFPVSVSLAVAVQRVKSPRATDAGLQLTVMLEDRLVTVTSA